MAHYNQDRRKARRCDWPGCGNRADDGSRKLGNGLGRKTYCREHEGHHLTATPELDALNRERLGNQLYPEGDCWFGLGEEAGGRGGYVLFEPVGAYKAKWLLHRATWAYLIGGHPQRIGRRAEPVVLDHLAGCTVGPKCSAPFHLEPVTASENQRRKLDRVGVLPINWGAALNPRVQQFAYEFGLPLPTVMPEAMAVA